VRDQLNPDEERHVLLHEMCHVATGPGVADHGPTFLRQLQRLIEKGETWAVGEYQYFAAEWRELKAVVDEEGRVEEQEAQSEHPSSRHRPCEVR
jgi:hypothetical protein